MHKIAWAATRLHRQIVLRSFSDWSTELYPQMPKARGARSYLSRRDGAQLHTLATKTRIVNVVPREISIMADDRREETPLVPGDELGEDATLAPQVTSLPDEDKRRLEALLRELLRDNRVRELLSIDEDAGSRPQAGL
jgi:hypothetical protein